jgi:hypothetical protein
MSDTTHPDVPSPEVPGASAQLPGTPTVSPTPANTHSEWGDMPEETLNEWRWIMKGREEGVFDEYAGKHVAVYQQKVWGSSFDPDLLREYLALKHQIDPEKFVMVYIDRW